MNGLTTGEAAKHLQIPQSTLKMWLSELPIQTTTDSRGRRRLNDDALAVLETVKDLRTHDFGLQTIRRRIVSGGGSVQLGDSQELGNELKNPHGDTGSSQPADNQELEGSSNALIAQVVAAIRSENEMSEKYARAAHQIGKLESENDFLRVQLAEAQKRIELLEAPKPRPWWLWRVW